MTLKEKIVLQEMANCRPAKTGLPVNIWIDEVESYKLDGGSVNMVRRFLGNFYKGRLRIH